MLRSIFLRILTVCFLTSIPLSLPRAEDKAPPPPVAAPTEEQLKTWVAQLGDADFNKREEAQAKLAEAGLSALPAVEAAQSSSDPEVKAAARRVYNKLRWLKLPENINYLQLMPAHCLLALHTPKFSELNSKGMQTALPKLLQNPAIKALVAQGAKALKQQGVAGRMIENLTAESQIGQAAIGLWMDPGTTEPSMLIAIETAALNTKEATKLGLDALQKMGMRSQPVQIEGIEAFSIAITDVKMIMAVVGKHVILTTSEAHFKQTVRAMLQTPERNLFAEPTYQTAQKKLGEGANLSLLLNVAAAKHAVTHDEPGDFLAPIIDHLGLSAVDTFMLNTYVVGDHFEDRFAINGSRAPEGLLSLLSVAAKEGTPLPEALAVAPADAAGVASINLDGAAMQKILSDFTRSMDVDPLADPLLRQGTIMGPSEIEKALGFTMDDTAALVKGNGVAWLRMPEMLGVPDLGAAVPCAGEAQAQKFAERIAKYVDHTSHILAEDEWAAKNGLIRLEDGKFEKLEINKEDEEDEKKPGDKVEITTPVLKGEATIKPVEDAGKTPEKKAEDKKPAEEPAKAPGKVAAEITPAPKPLGEKPGEKAEEKQPEPNYEELKKIEKGIVVSEENGHKFYTESEKGPQVTLEPQRQTVPYRLSWTAYGSRVIFASSIEALKKRVASLDKKEAGLDASTLLSTGMKLPEKGGVMVLDLKRVMTFGQRYGLPALAMLSTIQGKNDDAKMFGDLAANPELFKSLPSVFAQLSQDGDTITGSIQSPIPTLPAVTAAAVVGSMVYSMQMMKEQQQGGNVAPQLDQLGE